MPSDKFLVSYFTDTQAEMRWRREVEYKLLATLLPLAPLLVAGLFALSALGDWMLTVGAACGFTIFVWILYFYVLEKMEAEHKVYEDLGQVTVQIWERFGMFAEHGDIPAFLPEASRSYGKGDGYKRTLRLYLFINFAATLMLLGIGLRAFIAVDTYDYPDAALRVAAGAVRAMDTTTKVWRLHALSTSDDGTATTATFLRHDQDSGYTVTVTRASNVVASVEATTVKNQQAPALLSLFEVQRKLSHAGLYRGVIDGRMGPRTERAIREFQRDRGLTVTEAGFLDAPTLQELAELAEPR